MNFALRGWRLAHMCMAGLLALLPAAPMAQEVFSLSNIVAASPQPDYQLDFATDDHRFSFNSFPETRGQRSVRTFKLALGGIPGEVGALVTFPFRDPKTAGLFLLGTAALISIDRQTTSFWQDKVEPAFDGFVLPEVFSPIPNISQETQYVVATIGLTYAGGLIFNDERAQTAALLSTKAIAYSYLTTQVILKPIFGRLRPVPDLSTFSGDPGDFTTNPWDFGNGGGVPWTGGAYATSMPSYHFTQYFAMARVYSGIYDNKAWPYYAAGLISVANIRDHHHWFSDMVAGAVIGVGIGNLILNHYEDRKSAQDNLFIVPLVSRDRVGFQLSMEF